MDDLPDVAWDVLRKAGYNGFFPHQKDAIKRLLSNPDKNFLIRAPTGAGKTLIVSTAIEQHLRNGGGAIYAVPSRKLRKDKVKELAGMLSEGTEISLVGDGNGSKWDSDVVVGTFEGIYRAILSNKGLLTKYSLVVLDDFHTLYEDRRGYELEKLITLLKLSGVRIIALSATIEPVASIADWLDSEVIFTPDEVRPVEIEKNVLVMNTDDAIDWLATNFSSFNPVIVFNYTKLYTESRAKKLAEKLKPLFDVEEVKSVFREKKRDELDEDEEELAYVMSKGVAWHHSEVPDYIKDVIEEWFNEGKLKAIFATTTLAHGINSPTKTVVIMDMYRRWDLIPVHEWLQMASRAGRVGFSEEGAVYTIVRKESDAELVELKYHTGIIEPCESKLGDGDFYRKALLELIYKGLNTSKDIVEFMSNTYYYSQGNNEPTLLETQYGNGMVHDLRANMGLLYENGYIIPSGKGYALTEFGKAVMDFLWRSNIDVPLDEITQMRSVLRGRKEVSNAEALYITIYCISGLRLGINPPKDKVGALIEKVSSFFGGRRVGEAEVITYIILKDWIEGRDLDLMKNDYGKGVYYLRNRAKTIAEALKLFETVAKIEGVRLPRDFKVFIKRVYYGVTAYELPLVELRFFGRKIVHSIYVTLANVPATSKYVEKDEHIGITLKRLLDEVGEARFREIVGSWRIRHLGPKRMGALIKWLRNFDSSTDSARLGINLEDFGYAMGEDLSRWLD
ncbi:hypothetical protein DRP04_08760 [Archaeoglobales archaeon]|nr:MAG: hypothetical protein DRP04_08760 [Archaeoglobales archaeon]